MKTRYILLVTSISFFGLFVLAGLHAGTSLAVPPPVPMSNEPPRKRLKFITCNGARKIKLESVKIESAGTAVTIRDSCKLVIRDSVVISDKIALSIQDNGEIEASGTVFRGRMEILNKNSFKNLGGNTCVPGPCPR